MEKALTKYFWILNLVTLALVAYLLAGGTSQLAAAGLSDLLPAHEAGQQSGPALPVGPVSLRARNGGAILDRNIFDSIIGPIRPGGLDGETDDGAPLALTDGDLPMVPCPDGRYALLAAVASSTTPEWSFATVSVDRQTNLYRIGDRIGEREVSGISWRYLFLRGTADECYVDMFGDATSEKPRTKPMSLAAAGDELSKGIQVDGPNERTVDRALVDAALANPAQFARSVRVRPYKKDGEVTGFRLRRIQKGSPLEMLGAQQGDIIHAVNGVNLTSVDQALSAYQNLRSDSKLTFSITRQGKPQNLNINIK
ncbi:MAG TPA: type II secretion system protein GspC [Polyangia bacterium]|nr:type II secretion system protein GspC [Polyangia bacterium]